MNREIFKVLSRKHGLKINSEALELLATAFVSLTAEALQPNIDLIAQQFCLLFPDSHMIEYQPLKQTINQIMANRSLEEDLNNESLGLDGCSKYLWIGDTFAVQPYDFKVETGFIAAEKETALIGDANLKQKGFKRRLMRNKVFRKPTHGSKEISHKITPIIHLKGKRPGKFLLFGMITRIQEKLSLEDLDSVIQISFSDTITIGEGIFMVGGFVLAEGDYTEEGDFIVELLSQPLEEKRDETLAIHTSMFGGPVWDDKAIDVQENGEASFIIISDLWLDLPIVFTKLRLLFEGYSLIILGFSQAVLPLGFLFIGSFQSTPFQNNGQSAKYYKEQFDQFANLVAEFEEIARSCHFIFVPGPNDPWGAMTPRPRIPDSYVRRLAQKITNVHFTGNPCRIKYCNQEIVVYREDLMQQYRKLSLFKPPTTGDLAVTVLSQSYLTAKSTIWSHDSALILYPQPNVLILADKHEAYEEGIVINPGSWSTSEFQFYLYDPADNSFELSQI